MLHDRTASVLSCNYYWNVKGILYVIFQSLHYLMNAIHTSFFFFNPKIWPPLSKTPVKLALQLTFQFKIKFLENPVKWISGYSWLHILLFLLWLYSELLSWRNIEMSACFLPINKEQACKVSGVKRGMTNRVHI